jgi:DNA-binding transcriptional LysR family regulator
MDLRTLECFLAVAEEGSITRAAARLHMSQPPLTVRLQGLEKELGVPLLVRHGRGVELTAAGRVLVERGRRLLADVDGTAAAVRSVGHGISGRLSLAIGGSVAPRLLATLLRRVVAETGDVVLAVNDVADVDALDRVDHEEADVGLLVLPPRDASGPDAATSGRRAGDRGLETAVIAREPLVVVLRPDEAEAQFERTDLGALTDRVLIAPARARAPGLHQHAAAAWHAVDGNPDHLRESDSITTTLALVEAGIGIAIMPATHAEVAWDGLAAVPLRQHRPVAETAIVWRHSTTSPVLRRFLRLALSTPEPDVLGPERARH